MKKLFFLSAFVMFLAGFSQTKAEVATVLTLCKDGNCWTVVYWDLTTCSAARARIARLDSAGTTTVQNCTEATYFQGGDVDVNGTPVTPVKNPDKAAWNEMFGPGLDTKGENAFIFLADKNGNVRIVKGAKWDGSLDKSTLAFYAAKGVTVSVRKQASRSITMNGEGLDIPEGEISFGKHGDILIDNVPIEGY